MIDRGDAMDRTVWLPPLSDSSGRERLATAVALTVALHIGAVLLLLFGVGPLSGVTNAMAMSFFDPMISAEVVPLPRPEPVEPVPQAAAEPQPTPPPEPEKEPPKAEKEPPKPQEPPPQISDAEKVVPPQAPDIAKAEPPPMVTPFAPLAAAPPPQQTPMPPQPAPAPPAPSVPQIVTQSTPPPPAVTAEDPPAGGAGPRISDGFGERVPEQPRPERLPQIALAAPDDWSEVEPGDGAQVLLVPPEVLLGPDLPRPPPSTRGTSPPGVMRMATMVSRSGNATGPAPYPWAARANNLEGEVVLRLGIGADGAVVSINVQHSSGHAVLDEAAVQSAQGWRFRPPQYTGPGHVVGPVWIEVPINYRR